MPKINSESFQIFKSVFIIFCVIIVLTVITVGLGILCSQISKQSMPEEEEVDSILSFIKNFYLSKDFVFELNTK
jgi:flagellar basal body-associated protein FliL